MHARAVAIMQCMGGACPDGGAWHVLASMQAGMHLHGAADQGWAGLGRLAWMPGCIPWVWLRPLLALPGAAMSGPMHACMRAHVPPTRPYSSPCLAEPAHARALSCPVPGGPTGTQWFKVKRVSKEEYQRKQEANRRANMPADGEERMSPKEKIDQW